MTPHNTTGAQALSRAEVDSIVYACRQSGDDSTYAIVNAAIEALAGREQAGAVAQEDLDYENEHPAAKRMRLEFEAKYGHSALLMRAANHWFNVRTQWNEAWNRDREVPVTEDDVVEAERAMLLAAPGAAIAAREQEAIPCVCGAICSQPGNTGLGWERRASREEGAQPPRHAWEPLIKLTEAQSALSAQAATIAQLEEDALRYRLLRRGQHWSVINGIGDTLRAEALDAAIDAHRKDAT